MRDQVPHRLLWFVGVLGCTVLPLWLFKYIPSTDYPSHLAIAKVLWSGSPFYEFNLQPAPYYLSYALLAPAVGLLGAEIGGAVCVTIFAAIFIWGASDILNTRGLHPGYLVAVPWLFLGVSFFYGFFSGLAATSLGVAGIAMLVRLDREYSGRVLLVAALLGAAVTATHLAMLLPFACAAAAFFVCQPRKRVAQTAVLALASVAPALPWLVGGLFDESNSAAGSVVVDYGSLKPFVYYFTRQFQLFDQGMGRAGAVAISVCLLLAAVVYLRRYGLLGPPGQRLPVALCIAMVGLYAAMPSSLTISGSWGWVLNIRYFPFIGVAMLPLLPAAPRLARPTVVALCAASLLYFAGLMTFCADFDRSHRQFDTILAHTTADATLCVVSKQMPFAQSWPPVGLHMHAYHLATRGGFDSAVFAGIHMPIRATQRGLALACQNGLEQPWSVGNFDFLLLQHHPDIDRAKAPADGSLVVTTQAYTLYRRQP